MIPAPLRESDPWLSYFVSSWTNTKLSLMAYLLPKAGYLQYLHKVVRTSSALDGERILTREYARSCQKGSKVSHSHRFNSS